MPPSYPYSPGHLCKSKASADSIKYTHDKQWSFTKQFREKHRSVNDKEIDFTMIFHNLDKWPYFYNEIQCKIT